MGFDEDFEWQKRFRAHYSEISTHLTRAREAPPEEDWKRNTDLILSMTAHLPNRDIRISARARRVKYRSRYPMQFTVRLDRPSGAQAEMPKLRAGWGDFTIYGFESEAGSDRLHPWILGNLTMLRDYIAQRGYYEVRGNTDGSSRLAAFHLADMPLGFLVASEGIPDPVVEDAVWQQCRSCYWRQVMPLDDSLRPGDGQWRQCLRCHFRWRSGWVAPLRRAASA